MKSDNEIIAEFMRIKVVEWRFKDGYPSVLYVCNNDDAVDFTHDPTAYSPNRDWNLLMPVVEKIAGMFTSCNEDGEYPEITLQVMCVTNLSIDTSIHTVYRNVVEFIKWYNSQSTTSEKP